MRDGLGEKARWVEPARGSTLGLPDCWVPIDNTRIQTWVELKLATLKGDTLSYTLRPEQKKQISSMVADRLVVGIIAGLKGGDRVWAMLINEATLSGEFDLKIGEQERWAVELSKSAMIGANQGVYSIFFGVTAEDDG